jgi:hypothetical protein
MATSDWSDFLAVDWLDTSQSFYHPIIGCPDGTDSIWILCTIGLCEHIQYIQSTDTILWYTVTVHLEISSSHINIYTYSKATLHLSRLVTGSIDRGCIFPFFLSVFLIFPPPPTIYIGYIYSVPQISNGAVETPSAKTFRFG